MCAVFNLAVFCSLLILCFPNMWLRYFLNDFKMVPVVPFIVDITYVFTFHFHSIFLARSLYFRIIIIIYNYIIYYYCSFIVLCHSV